MFGFLLVDKPQGFTSHDAVAVARRQLGTKKVGHAGTLDPIATGLLVMAVGPATKLLPYLQLDPKTYDTTFRFGQTTNTYDAEGEVIDEQSVPSDLLPQLATILDQFTGRIRQVPPMFSAVKIDGRRLYHEARKGIEVERPSREVNVRSIELVEQEGSDVKLKIICDSGTYVRSLAHDMGEALGCGAHVLHLRRTTVGSFKVEDACQPDQIDPSLIMEPQNCLTHVQHIAINEGQLAYILNGNPIRLKRPAEPGVALLRAEDGPVVALGRCSGAEVFPVKVFKGQ